MGAGGNGAKPALATLIDDVSRIDAAVEKAIEQNIDYLKNRNQMPHVRDNELGPVSLDVLLISRGRMPRPSPARIAVSEIGSATPRGLPRSGGPARHPVWDRYEAAVDRHDGTIASGGSATFPTRRAARQAASEIAGDLGPRAIPIRASAMRGAPWTWRGSLRVIGREAADGSVYWRDDVLGHPRFGAGPHVNVGVDGIEFHLYY
jgi:hypothetical protein